MQVIGGNLMSISSVIIEVIRSTLAFGYDHRRIKSAGCRKHAAQRGNSTGTGSAG
jgi:hypothetical protein